MEVTKLLAQKENTMHALKLLHKMLENTDSAIHQKRRMALLAGVGSLLSGAFLTVTALGRNVNSPARTKHNIKRMDRLLSNPHLQYERSTIYRALCHHLCRGNPRPIILVDWSDIIERDRLMLIRAALAVEGRSIPIYEAIYPLKKYNAPKRRKPGTPTH